jgi:epsilon-lactone hydrolase
MASTQSQTVTEWWRRQAAAMSNPDPSGTEPDETNFHWPNLTAEPGGIDYLETDADGIPAM